MSATPAPYQSATANQKPQDAMGLHSATPPSRTLSLFTDDRSRWVTTLRIRIKSPFEFLVIVQRHPLRAAEFRVLAAGPPIKVKRPEVVVRRNPPQSGTREMSGHGFHRPQKARSDPAFRVKTVPAHDLASSLPTPVSQHAPPWAVFPDCAKSSPGPRLMDRARRDHNRGAPAGFRQAHHGDSSGCIEQASANRPHGYRRASAPRRIRTRCDTPLGSPRAA